MRRSIMPELASLKYCDNLRSPDGHTKNEINYIMTDKPSMVTDVTVIHRINIGSDHRMEMGSVTLNTKAEKRKLLNKNTRTRVDTQMI